MPHCSNSGIVFASSNGSVRAHAAGGGMGTDCCIRRVILVGTIRQVTAPYARCLLSSRYPLSGLAVSRKVVLHINERDARLGEANICHLKKSFWPLPTCLEAMRLMLRSCTNPIWIIPAPSRNNGAIILTSCKTSPHRAVLRKHVTRLTLPLWSLSRSVLRRTPSLHTCPSPISPSPASRFRCSRLSLLIVRWACVLPTLI